MARPRENDKGEPPFRSTVSLPTWLTENPGRHDQQSRFEEGSSVDFSPFDFETLESGISRMSLQDFESQNLRRAVGSFGVSNSSGNVSSSSKTPNPPSDSVRFENLKGTILQLAKDQNYSRFLQQIIDEEEVSGNKIGMIFNEVINSVDELMMDRFGLPVFQKLLDKCNDLQIAQIINVISRNPNSFVKVCTDSLGTRALQTLQESLRSQELASMFTRSLSTIALPLCKNSYGHHVIQNCLQHYSAEENMSLMSEMARNCYQIATDPSGCNMLQRCLMYCMGGHRHCLASIRRHFFSVILANALYFAGHTSGNYVVQFLLELRDPKITAALLGRLEGSFATLSRDRHGSHVVQKALTIYGEEHSERIISELIGDLRMLVLDPFGNYVIQAALVASKGQNHMRGVLIGGVRENYPMMVCNQHGRKVLQKLQEILSKKIL